MKTHTIHSKYEVIEGLGVKSLRTGKWMAEGTNNKGYPITWLKVGGKVITVQLHTLMAKCFIPNPESLEVVDHRNRCIQDFATDNLRWVTRQDNIENRGYTIEVYAGDELVKSFPTLTKAARYLDVSLSAVSQALLNNHNCKGFGLIKAPNKKLS